MKEARDIVAVSLPFAAGIAGGTFLLGLGWADAFLCTEAALFLVLVLFWMQFRFKVDCYVPLFASLGLFCAFNSDLSAPYTIQFVKDLQVKSISEIKEYICNIAYPHEDSASLVLALLTGNKSLLSQEQVNWFRISGASHILALSGLHLGIIYLVISKALLIFGNSPKGRKIKSTCIITVAGAYTLMTGAGASIVRALIFIIINELSQHSSGRTHQLYRTLLVSLTIQLCLRPSVIFEIGFQLSYLAMIGIAFIFPILRDFYPRTDGKSNPMIKMWENMSMSISCQITTAPLVWIRFKSFPHSFLLTNLIALPLTTIVITLSLVTLTLSCLGLCPEIMIILNDYAIQLLLESLRIISMI